MSPAAKTKSKPTSKASKEQTKISKSSVSSAGNNGITASAYNPVSGTFHTLETAPLSPSQLHQNNGRFRSIDETDDHSGSSPRTTTEYDSVSNNDSCSGDSEDQKEKLTASTTRPELVPGCDTDKRDKNRQKNEKKHQRQRERRAQELHERCSGYLMSRKLEALAQQLVGMGFSSELATMALMLNEGRLEDSITWLVEGGAESKQMGVPDGAVNLKIDINDELQRIVDMETKFKCTKQEVERAVVANEGDLNKAADMLRSHKQETTAAPKPEEIGDQAPPGNKVAGSLQIPQARLAVAKGDSPPSSQQQQRDLNYVKPAVNGNASLEYSNKNMLPGRRVQLKPDWIKPQTATPLDKRWVGASPVTAVSSLASPLQHPNPLMKLETRQRIAVSDGKPITTQPGMLREPIIMMQRPQSANAKQILQTLPSFSTGLAHNLHGGLGHVNQNSALSGSNLVHLYAQQSNYNPFPPSLIDSGLASGYSGSSLNIPGPAAGVSGAGGSNPALRVSTKQLAVPSSLGLFTGWGSAGSSGGSSPVDWSTGGSMAHCDYKNVDWSLHSAPLGPSMAKQNDLWDTWSPFHGAKAMRPTVNSGVYMAGLQDGGGLAMDPASAGSYEWTSPFAGKDLFSVPRQFVTSPSL